MQEAGIEIAHPVEGNLSVELLGNWHMEEKTPSYDLIWQIVQSNAISTISFKAQSLQSWDTALLTFLTGLADRLRVTDVELNLEELPNGVQQLFSLARAVPKKEEVGKTVYDAPFLVRIGEDSLHFFRSVGELFSFIGEILLPVFRFFSGKMKVRWGDLGIFVQETGAFALPIVCLISFLFGVILAYVGIMQLKLFGAQIYVADLVGIATVRVMGAVMTGIIMAGRTGASFAAQLGTMQVNEEIDALKTLAVSPVEFLVLPRLIALTLMMPLLTLFADLMGIVGGALIASGVYDINLVVYFNRISEAVSLADLFMGLFKGLVFGVLIALSGCLRGIQCGRDASAVGEATTSAVVTSIVAIIIATAIIIVLSSILGFS